MSVALLLGLLASSVAALPQQGGSQSTSVIQSISGTVIGSISSVGSRSSSSSTRLPSGFTAPPTQPTSYQNTSGIPSTPIRQNPSLPSFAIDYAPVMYLHENESYWPSAWDVHLSYVYPWIDYQPLNNVPNPLTLENLNFTTSYSLYLSMENPTQEPRPQWLYSEYGKPDQNGFSASNVTVIAVNKSASIAPGYVDVFYFYLYSFNEGDNVGGQTYGNHVSDIEYTMIRFLNGEPRFMFLSQHQDGQAYEWQAVQKDGNGRPIAYVAHGGHANYPVAGAFQLVQGLVGLLQDETTAGYRWDTALNYNGYWYSQVDGFVTAGGNNASTQPNGPPGIGYLQQTGKWGNEQLPASDPEQAIVFGQPRWSDGGTGPIDPSKSLPRTWLCVQSNCPANASLPASSELQAGQFATTTGAGTASVAGVSVLFVLPLLAALLL